MVIRVRLVVKDMRLNDTALGPNDLLQFIYSYKSEFRPCLEGRQYRSCVPNLCSSSFP